MDILMGPGWRQQAMAKQTPASPLNLGPEPMGLGGHCL